MSHHRWLFVQGAILLLSCGLLSAQDSPEAPEPPALAEPFRLVDGRKVASKRPSDIKQGLALFRAFCSRCHGRDGDGGKGPSLIDGKYRRVSNDEEIVNVIANGITGAGMPGFGPGFEYDYWQVTAYLRDAADKNATPPALIGDVANGKKLFKKHQCASCHWTGKEGGRRGTDLTRLAAKADYVRQALVDPDSSIDGHYQQVQLLLDNDRVVNGRRLFEDAYYLLVMTVDESLKTIDKKQISILQRPNRSLMPSYRQHLTLDEIEDLTAYVFSLQQKIEK